MAKKQKEVLEDVQPNKKMYKASLTAKVGSNADGSEKFNLIKDESILLTTSEAKILKKYLK